MKFNILPSTPASCISIRMPCFHVNSYAFTISKKIYTIGSLSAWASLTVASRDKICSINVSLDLPPHCIVDSVPFWSKKSNSLTFTLVPLLCIDHLLEHLDDNLKGWLGLFQVLIFVLMWTLSICQGSIIVDIFCFTERGESLILFNISL